MKYLAILFAMMFVGCTKVVYIPQEVLIPVACIERLPDKPKLGNDNYTNVITLQKAYLEMRLILSSCVRSTNDNF